MNTFASFNSSILPVSSSSANGNSSRNALLNQLCKRTLLRSNTGHLDSSLAVKESLLQSMGEHILSSSMNTIVPLEPHNAPTVLDLCQRRLSPQAASRFLPLARAFLDPSAAAAASGLVIGGGELFSRKLQLLYFLMRVAERSNSSPSGQPLLNLVKKPEEIVNGRLVEQINSRIEGLLAQQDNNNVHRRPIGNENYPSAATATATAPPAIPTSPIPSPLPAVSANSNVWDLFENVRRRDYGGVDEEVLVRDLIFVLQGLDGSFLRFSAEAGKYCISERLSGISRPIRVLVERLGAIGSDFRFVQNSIAVHREQAGVLKQSFCRAMAAELAEYLKLVAFLESTLSAGALGNGFAAAAATNEPVTLKKVVFWFHEAGLLLSVLREIVQASESLKGGALLSFLESHRLHGNERVRVVLSRLLDQMLIPFSEMLNGWLADGSVNDPFGEFFIARAQSSLPVSWEFDAAGLWNKLFTLRQSELPAFIPEELAKRALIAGKTRLFIQAYLRDLPVHLKYTGTTLTALNEDVEMRDDLTVNYDAVDPSSNNNNSDFLQQMEKDMTKAYSVSCKQVKAILMDDCRLLDQLRVIRQYMLLGKGDFSLMLMDSLADALDRPAATLFRHNLVGILETAIRGCSHPPNTPDWILDCLDVRALERGASATALNGWDAFVLDYRTAFPVNCILDPECMGEYGKLSRCLWSLKRTEFVLNRSWQQLRRLKSKKAYRKWELLHFEMACFVRAAISWSFEVIEDEAATFESALQGMLADGCCGLDLDAVIRAHRSYLLGLKTKLRLWSSSNMRSKTAALEATIKRFCDEISQLTSMVSTATSTSTPNFLSIARHWQVEIDDLLMSVEREAGGASSPAAQGIMQRLDYTEYHRRRNGFDVKKYN